MDATERRLRDAVLAATEDDIPRLQYADWLVERGDPRGEFIRTQCALAVARGASSRMALRAREKRLLRAHRVRWSKDASEVARKVVFTRGFISELWLWSKTMDAVQKVLANEPVTRIVLALYRSKRAGLEALLKTPGIERLRSLKVSGGSAELGEEGVKMILGAGLTSLKRLNFGTSPLSVPTLKLLARAPSLAGLEVLSLSGNSKVTDEIAAGFVAPESAFGLEGLHLSGTEVTSDFVTQLAASPRASRMKYLSLARTVFDDAGAEAIAGAVALSGLRVLDLGRTELSAEGARWLASSPNLNALMRLDLRGTEAAEDPEVGALLKKRFGSAVRLGRSVTGGDEDFEPVGDDGDDADDGDDGD